MYTAQHIYCRSVNKIFIEMKMKLCYLPYYLWWQSINIQNISSIVSEKSFGIEFEENKSGMMVMGWDGIICKKEVTTCFQLCTTQYLQ